MLRSVNKFRTIKSELIFSIASISALTILLILFEGYRISLIFEYKEGVSALERLKATWLEAQNFRNQFMQTAPGSEDFHLSHKSTYFDASIASADNAIKIIKSPETRDFMKAAGISSQLNELTADITEFKTAQKEVAQLLLKRGFKDSGLEGKLRESIHAVEAMSVPYDKALMLTLRRHEKDFFLRKDTAYHHKFKTGIAQFKNEFLHLPGEQSEKALVYISNYEKMFDEAVETEKALGLHYNTGVNGNIILLSQHIADVIEQSRVTAASLAEKKEKQEYIISGMGLSVILLLSWLLTRYNVRKIEKPINEVNHYLKSLSGGYIPEKINYRGQDPVFKTIARGLNLLIDRLKRVSSFAEGIAGSRFDTEFVLLNEKDELGLSLIKMRNNLKEKGKMDTERLWINNGLNEFNKLLNAERSDMEQLCDKALSFLIKYTGMNQGGIYLLKKNEATGDLLTLTAYYAYHRKKYLQREFEKGEGLIGRCLLENDTLYITEVPADYALVTSGVGEALPRQIIMIPLRFDEEVIGVMEMAGFEVLELHQKEFLEKAVTGMASTLHVMRSKIETENLYKLSVQQSQMLHEQQEEMRQNMEELLATQEEMRRKEDEYISTIELLEYRLNHPNELYPHIKMIPAH